MKKLLNLTILFFAASLILPSCSNDDADEQEPKANHFQVVDQKYLLQEGTLVYIEEDLTDDPNTRYDMDLTFFSKGIQVASADPHQVVFKGIGQQLFFALNVSSKTDLDQGVFDLKSEKVTVGMYCENWIDEKHDADQNPWSRLTDGEISISKKGDLYEIILTAIDDKNHNVSAYFKGKLNFYSLEN